MKEGPSLELFRNSQFVNVSNLDESRMAWHMYSLLQPISCMDRTPKYTGTTIISTIDLTRGSLVHQP